MPLARPLLLAIALMPSTSLLAQDRVKVSVKHVLGGILNARSIGTFTFDFEIREAFRQMNALLERERLSWRLELDEIVDVDGISKYFKLTTDDAAAFEDEALSDPEEFLWRDDAIRLFGFLFLGGTEPATPGARACGTDPTDDDAFGCVAAGC